MRRGSLLLTLLPFAVVTPVQAQVHFDIPPPSFVAKASPDDLVARILSFDRNDDGRVTKDELNERMAPLVSRGDVNGDNALDGTELRTMASVPAAPPPVGVRGLPFSIGRYGFADEAGLSPRFSHVQGALDDLRLASSIRAQARRVATDFIGALEASAPLDLWQELEALLTAEQLADVNAHTGSARLPDVGRPDVHRVVFVDGSHITIRGLERAAMFQEIARRLAQFDLTPAQNDRLRAAIVRFNARLRLDDTERSRLVEQMAAILSDEERDNLRAALARRPVVRTEGALAVDFFAGPNSAVRR